MSCMGNHTVSVFYYFMCTGILSACMFVHHVHAKCPRGQNRASYLLELELRHGCESQCGCWESDLGPRKERAASALTTAPSLQLSVILAFHFSVLKSHPWSFLCLISLSTHTTFCWNTYLLLNTWVASVFGLVQTESITEHEQTSEFLFSSSP